MYDFNRTTVHVVIFEPERVKGLNSAQILCLVLDGLMIIGYGGRKR